MERKPGKWSRKEPPLLTLADVDTSKILHKRLPKDQVKALKKTRKLS